METFLLSVGAFLIPTILIGIRYLVFERRQAAKVERYQQVMDDKVHSKVTDPDRMRMVDEAEQYMDDPRLIHLTRVVASVMKAPLALVTLVKDNKQCFLASTDLSGKLEGVDETTLEESFCRYVVATKNPLEIDETLIDPLVQNSETVKKYGIRSYLGVPVRHREEVIGALCALDIVPREWTEDEYKQLFEFAALVDNILESPPAYQAGD